MRIAAAVVALLTAAGTASADRRSERPDQVCQRAYRSATDLEKGGQLIEARGQLEICAQSSCGRFLEHACTLGLDRLESDTPTVIPVVLDADGEPVAEVRVTMDGELLTDEVNGLALAIDPGVHQFTVAVGDDRPVARRLVISEGRRNRKIVFRLQAAGSRSEQSPAAPHRQRPARSAAISTVAGPTVRAHRASALPGYLLASAGVLGVGGWGVLSWWGRKDNDLLARCSPDCAQSDVDHIHTLYLAADVSLGVGITALVAGTWMIWRSHSTYTLEVSPTRSGAAAVLSGEF
jgi:hypothetical protein